MNHESQIIILHRYNVNENILSLSPTAKKTCEERVESLSDGANNHVRHTRFFKYPWIFHHVSMDISLRIRGYFIKYPWIF